MSESVVYMVGHEFTLDAYGLVPGSTYPEREHNGSVGNFDIEKWKSVLSEAFRKIIALCKEVYGYQIAYAASVREALNVVPWSDPIFESVCTDAYIWDAVGGTAEWAINHFSQMKQYGKPVNSTEWCCKTYKGAANMWLNDLDALKKYPYDEDEQANYIEKYCNMLNEANITGAFCTQYNTPPWGYGLYNGLKRKKGFYMYKSYKRSS